MNDADVPEYGAVFTFGKSKFADNIPSQFFIRNDPIVEISCGDQHTAVVCKYGRVYSFGSNEWGQLGLGHKDPVNKPSCIKSLKPEKVKHVACGRAHTIFTTENGKVYSCGCNTDGQLGVGNNDTVDYVALPIFVTELDEEIVQVAAGSQHSVLLTSKGIVYVWGSNSEGQLGLLESDTRFYVDPTLLSVPYSISYISCGYYHTGFVTVDGKLLLCGDTENGQLGIETEAERTWTLMEARVPGIVVSVACGGQHTIALTNNGGCYVCGNNSAGQLGIENLTSTSTWTHLHFDDVISEVSAGENHSMFLTDAGIVYACGDSKYGKLCINENIESNVTKPVKINFLFSTLKVNRVACGGCHTMILACPISPSTRLSTIKDVKLSRTDDELPFEDGKMNKANLKQTKFSPENLQISAEDASQFPTQPQRSEFSWNHENESRSFEDVSEKNSPNFESTRSLKSDDSEMKTHNVNEDKISSLENKAEHIQDLDEIKKEPDVQADEKSEYGNTNISLYSNGKSPPEGKFKRILRHIGVQKIMESKHDNNNVRSSYVKGAAITPEKDRESNQKCSRNQATSKVCTML